MALLLMEGFDEYNTEAELYTHVSYGYLGSNPAHDPSTFARINGRSLRFGSNDWFIMGLDAPSTDTQWLNCAYYSAYTAAGYLMQARNKSGQALYSVYRNASGYLAFYTGVGDSLLGTTSASLPNTQWVAIGIEVYCHDTLGTVDITFDGVSVLSLTSQDTNGAYTDNAIVELLWYYMASVYNYLDDVIFGDDSGTDLTAHPGDCHIEMLLPDGNGTTNDWTKVSGTANYEMVDEGPPIDDDTTYVYSSTATHKDLYTVGNLTTSGDAYYAVQLRVKARKEQAGFREINYTIRSNVTEVDSGGFGVATSYNFNNHIFENDPDGGGAWDEAAINAMQVGIELKT